MGVITGILLAALSAVAGLVWMMIADDVAFMGYKIKKVEGS